MEFTSEAVEKCYADIARYEALEEIRHFEALHGRDETSGSDEETLCKMPSQERLRVANIQGYLQRYETYAEGFMGAHGDTETFAHSFSKQVDTINRKRIIPRNVMEPDFVPVHKAQAQRVRLGDIKAFEKREITKTHKSWRLM